MSLKSKRSRLRKDSIYRSGLEASFAAIAPKRKFKYEPFDVPYIMHRKYKPDFVHARTGTLLELKGFFRTGDTMKYKAIRDCIAPYRELIFVLSDPNKKLRKGAKMTMGQWCDKEGFKHYTLNDFDKLMQYVDSK
jgi:hypothetical protein